MARTGHKISGAEEMIQRLWKRLKCFIGFHSWEIDSKEFSHGWMWTTFCARCNRLKTDAGGNGKGPK
jgi:hypothetical protein